VLRGSELISQYDFTGGINVNAPPHLLGKDECYLDVDSLNGTKNVYWKNGAVYKRLGTEKVNSTAVGNFLVNGVRVYRSVTPYQTTIVAIDDGTNVKIYYLDVSDVFQEITKSDPQIANGSMIHFAVWKNKVYVASGDQPIQVVSYSGGWNITDITGLSYKPQVVCLHKDRLWAAGGDMPMGYFECTAYDDDTSWSSGDGEAFYAGLEDGDPIIQLKPLLDDLIIYKQDSIWIMKGDNLQNWFQHRDEKSVGCYAPYSVADIGVGHIFLSSDNIYFFDGRTILPIGDNIKPILDNIPISYRKYAAATYHNGFYRIAFSLGMPYNEIEFIFDVTQFINRRRATWWYNDGRDIANYIPYDGVDDDGYLYMCDSNAGYLRKMDTGTQDDGDNITAQLQTKYHDFGQPNVNKMYDRLKIDLSSGIGDVKITTFKGVQDEAQFEQTLSSGEASGVWGSSNWGEFSWTSGSKNRTTLELALPPEMDGDTLSIRTEHSGDEQNVKFFGYSLNWKVKSF